MNRIAGVAFICFNIVSAAGLAPAMIRLSRVGSHMGSAYPPCVLIVPPRTRSYILCLDELAALQSIKNIFLEQFSVYLCRLHTQRIIVIIILRKSDPATQFRFYYRIDANSCYYGIFA